tara:strand:- start:3 stop:467 length:465 start_codon:yes stop_codon:yes gene_type:complete
MAWNNYLIIFGLAQVKFLFAPSIAYATMPELSFLEIFISTTIGALFCFNLVFFLSKKIMVLSHKRRVYRNLNSGSSPKKIFTKRNKWIVKIKLSDRGFLLICFLAPLFLSIPIGTIIVAKFYGERPISYYFVSILLIFTSFLLTFLNNYLFGFF